MHCYDIRQYILKTIATILEFGITIFEQISLPFLKLWEVYERIWEANFQIWIAGDDWCSIVHRWEQKRWSFDFEMRVAHILDIYVWLGYVVMVQILNKLEQYRLQMSFYETIKLTLKQRVKHLFAVRSFKQCWMLENISFRRFQCELLGEFIYRLVSKLFFIANFNFVLRNAFEIFKRPL